MHRAIPVLAATAGGLALLASFHSSPSSLNLAAGAAPGSTTTQPAPVAPAAPEPTQGSTSTSKPSGSTTTTSAPPAGNRTVDGPVVSTDFGNVQVRVTLQGTRIVDVQALELPSDRSRSARLSQYAGPLLRQETLKAQSANIDLVSGASYTSEGYAQSLQAALDQAGK
jgi:uncharacterized protein with FMN-binding domain